MRGFSDLSHRLLTRAMPSVPFSWRAVAIPRTHLRDGEGAGGAPAQRHEGRITAWNSLERRGTVEAVVDGEQRQFAIHSARDFETVVPAHVRDLVGMRATFTEYSDADRAVVYNKLQRPTFRQPIPLLAHKDLLAEALQRGKANDRPVPSEGPAPLRAANIILDLSDAPAPDAASIHNIRPPADLKDISSSAIFSEAELQAVEARRGGAVQRTQQTVPPEGRVILRAGGDHREQAQPAGRDVVVTGAKGRVIAWSALHRSGVVECSDDGQGGINANAACIIRNVDAFDAAMPTAINLRGQEVTFTAVRYTGSDTVFAEEIRVPTATNFNLYDEAAAREQKVQERRQHRMSGMCLQEDDSAGRLEDAAKAALFGVVTRWSGGQGSIDASSGRTYFVDNASAFVDVVDATNVPLLRGAVVTFTVRPDNHQFAQKITLLSSTQDRGVRVAPPPPPQSQPAPQRSPPLPLRSTTAPAADTPVEGDESPTWRSGVLVTWSALERQGIIQEVSEQGLRDVDALGRPRGRVRPEEDVDAFLDGVHFSHLGERYLLRDVERNVETKASEAEMRVMLRKGRTVRFMSTGTTGRVATSVSLTMTALTPAEREEVAAMEAEAEKEATRTLSAKEEAVGSPTSGTYWTNRLEKAGFDMAELREAKGDGSAAINPYASEDKRLQRERLGIAEDDDKDDPISIIEQDPWFKDPQKNVRLPGTNMRIGDIQKTSPAAMMGLANKIRDPVNMEKTKNKYVNKLPEHVKEWAWNQAKEYAPRYEKRIREAKAKGEEPRFTFY